MIRNFVKMFVENTTTGQHSLEKQINDWVHETKYKIVSVSMSPDSDDAFPHALVLYEVEI